MEIRVDHLVIGSGISGLSYALKAAKLGTVAIVTKFEPYESSTNYAQGGIAAVLDKADSFDAHVEDTMTAGAGICHRDVVEMVVRDGPERIRELMELGVKFTHDENNQPRLGKEGGHSHRRIIHADDLTGREVERALLAQAEAEPNIRFYDNHVAIDLITTSKLNMGEKDDRCIGAYVLEVQSGRVITFLGKVVILATGGSSKVYLYTSNPDIATGDGIAMAYRAGAQITNMEFFQFHPTCLFHPQAKNYLISEAVRGEGGLLKLRDGTRFMPGYSDMAELAPRDIVARAIDSELKRTGDDYVLLDITHKGADFIKDRFPNIHENCLKYGIDITREPIPVVPAAHYSCGGVLVNHNGQSNIKGLFACGEVAFTGLHGANRLASNSLLEAIVYADRIFHCVESVCADSALPETLNIPDWDIGYATEADEAVVITQNWDEVRRLMWNYVGIVRSTKRLDRALRRIGLLKQEIAQYYWDFIVTRDLLELRNLVLVAELTVRSAMERKESRGLHYTLDYPSKDDENFRHDTILIKPPGPLT